MDFVPDRANRPRVTAHMTINYEDFEEEARGIGRNFSMFTNDKEQPYDRNIKVGEEWTELDFNWVESVGAVMVINDTVGKRQVKPTEEEIAEEMEMTLEIAIGKTSNKMPFTIPPRGFQPFWMEEDAPIFLRCRKGTAKVRLFAACR